MHPGDPPELQMKLLLQERGLLPTLEQTMLLMELHGLPNPLQLSECLDWEVMHLNGAIWEVLMERRDERGWGKHRAALCIPVLTPK